MNIFFQFLYLTSFNIFGCSSSTSFIMIISWIFSASISLIPFSHKTESNNWWSPISYNPSETCKFNADSLLYRYSNDFFELLFSSTTIKFWFIDARRTPDSVHGKLNHYPSDCIDLLTSNENFPLCFPSPKQ